MLAKKSRDSWRLIHTEFKKIGQDSLNKINEKLGRITMRFQASRSVRKQVSVDSWAGAAALQIQN